MRQRIRLIRIDPVATTVEELCDELLTLERLYELTGCRCVTTFRVDHDHIAYCDDNGMYRTPDENGCLPLTWFKRANQPIVGPIVIVGDPSPMDEDGYETSCTLTVDQIDDAIDRFGDGVDVDEPLDATEGAALAMLFDDGPLHDIVNGYGFEPVQAALSAEGFECDISECWLVVWEREAT